MPIYAYVCASCDRAQEHIHGLHEGPPPCEGCGASSKELERQLSAPSFRFERSVGWDGWDRMGNGMIGREVSASKHIDDPVPQRNPGSRKTG